MGPGPDNGQAQTLHLLGLNFAKANVATGRVAVVVGTTGATLLAVISGPLPHVWPLSGNLAPRATDQPDAPASFAGASGWRCTPAPAR
jgi:hypothetical protein